MRRTGPRPPQYDGSALCSQTDWLLFFPNKGDSLRPARRLCAMCPFLTACREYALYYDLHGIWGGTSRQQRAHIREERGIVALPVVTYWDHREPLAS